MKKKFLFITIFVLSLTNNIDATENLYDSIILRIENKVITRNELQLSINQAKRDREIQNLPHISDLELNKFILNDMIRNILLAIESDFINIPVSQQELDSETENYKKRNNLTNFSFEELLRKLSATPTEFKQRIVSEIKKNRLISMEVRQTINITDEMLEEVYDQKYNQSYQYTVRHILRQIPPDAKEEDQQKSNDEAIYIMDKLKENEEEWDTLALTYSDDPSVQQNKGVLPAFLPDQVMAEFADAVKDLEVRKITGPIKSPFGYHIIQLLKKERNETSSFEDLKDTIRNNLYQTRLKDETENYINKLKQKYPVKIIDPSLNNYIN